MIIHSPSDTICAISTAAGIGGIAIIRVSGRNALDYFQPVFSKDLSNVASHTAHFGVIKLQHNVVLDEVIVTLFHENKSFTGELTIEIACHGSLYIQYELLRLLIANGCRLAEPGEFTMRAFLNGRMDLSQAEAVGDLIASESKKGHQLAMNQMRGGFSSELKILREQLIHFASLVELELDFAEEDVEFADRKQLNALIDEVLVKIGRLMRSFELGNVIKNGVPVAIVGAPNTGKSTLLNQLLGEDRAIVSNIAGTTRDVIEETLNINGILYRLIDTAGIRDEAEDIEALGIARSHEKIRQATVVFVLIDLSSDVTTINEATGWANQLATQFPDKKITIVANKVDIAKTSKLETNLPVHCISAQTGEGIEALKAWAEQVVLGDFDTQSDTIVSNARHLEALGNTQEALQKAKFGLETGVTGDFIAMDIRQGMFYLGSITGDISTEDLLGNIFSKFCIGK